MFVWIFHIREKRFKSYQSKSIVSKSFCIVGSRFVIYSDYFISQYKLRSFDFLFYSSSKHIVNQFFISHCREFFFDFTQDICEHCHVSKLISANIIYHPVCGFHFLLIGKRIEECKSIVEIKSLEKKVSD